MGKRIFLFVVLLAFATNLFSQNVANKQFTLLNYDLSISKELTQELTSLESYIEGIKTYNDPGNNKLEAILVHTIYYTLKEQFEEQLKMIILPINSFLNKVKYNDYGYPKTNIRTALKKGYSKFYFKINVNIESVTEETREEDPKMFENITEPVVLPKITIEITIYNEEGVIPVDKWVSNSIARNPLPINQYLLKGFDNKTMEILPIQENQKDNIYLITNRAIQSIIHNYKNKK